MVYYHLKERFFLNAFTIQTHNTGTMTTKNDARIAISVIIRDNRFDEVY